ncbi:MAG TPA: dihydropteroate synthase [Solirubrobacteraceae bacterium]|nr:dihydropteroate synthase [Solirubrobacteraceae bacterium]
MGVVNVTPDSFSDGGEFLDARAAVARAGALVAEGADILDVGGESTRPGAEPVTLAEELRRVMPVLEAIAASSLPHKRSPAVSIDTVKAPVARAAIAAGVSIVNDVSALRADPHMAGLVAEHGVRCCLMHMLGEPRTMQREPRYGDVVDDVKAFLEERLRFAVDAGVPEENVLLDPGIGFGKTVEHNLALLDRLDELAALGRPVVIGTSRKSFIGWLLARAVGEREPVPASERLAGTIATNVLALERGASIFRVHDVAPVRGALEIAAATLGARCRKTFRRSPRS